MGPKWREDSISLKSFYKLSQQEKEEYLFLLQGLHPGERGDTDDYIIHFHSKQINKPKEFLDIEETL
jgi:hypothetical protein